LYSTSSGSTIALPAKRTRWASSRASAYLLHRRAALKSAQASAVRGSPASARNAARLMSSWEGSASSKLGFNPERAGARYQKARLRVIAATHPRTISLAKEGRGAAGAGLTATSSGGVGVKRGARAP
jgi:hypothetical protein